MNSQIALYSCLILFGTFISSVSQVILKKSAKRKYDSIIKEYLNAPVIIAYSIFVLATLCAVYAYKVVPLSLGPILEATSYIYVTFFGSIFFGEKITKKKVIALVLIISGIIVFSLFS